MVVHRGIAPDLNRTRVRRWRARSRNPAKGSYMMQLPQHFSWRAIAAGLLAGAIALGGLFYVASRTVAAPMAQEAAPSAPTAPAPPGAPQPGLGGPVIGAV